MTPAQMMFLKSMEEHGWVIREHGGLYTLGYWRKDGVTGETVFVAVQPIWPRTFEALEREGWVVHFKEYRISELGRQALSGEKP